MPVPTLFAWNLWISSVSREIPCKVPPVTDRAKLCLEPVLTISRRAGWQVAILLIALGLGCRRELSDAEGVKATYDPKTGRLTELIYDANHNGKPDSVARMDGTRILRIEVDTDESGVPDRWDYYDAERRLTKMGWSRRHDGVEDAWTYRDTNGNVSRIEISTRRNGRSDRVEFYEQGAMVGVEEDQDGDGRIDKWETYAIEPGTKPEDGRYAVTSMAWDSRHRGIPEKRFVYGAGGKVVRVDVADDRGRFETPAPTAYPVAVEATRE